MLKKWEYDYYRNTPPVSWFCPHIISVYKHWATFVANIHKKINAGWIHGILSFLPTVPFRIVGGAVIPETKQPTPVPCYLEPAFSRTTLHKEPRQQRCRTRTPRHHQHCGGGTPIVSRYGLHVHRAYVPRDGRPSYNCKKIW